MLNNSTGVHDEAAHFRIRFNGPESEIDSNTLTHVLIGVTAILGEVNKHVRPESKIEVKIRALSSGCFNVDMSLLHDLGLMAAAFSAPQNLKTLEDIFKYFVEILKLKKTIGGDKPVSTTIEGDVVTVTTTGGTSYYSNDTYNIFLESKPVQNEVKRTFSALKDDEAVTGFDVIEGQGNLTPVFRAQREDFKRMAAPVSKELLGEQTSRTKPEEATLVITRLSFEDAKWDFVYRGIKITSVTIEDVDFIEQVNAGEPFAKGDALTVTLLIEQEYDKDANAWLNKGYKIGKVSKHHKRDDRQGSLLES